MPDPRDAEDYRRKLLPSIAQNPNLQLWLQKVHDYQRSGGEYPSPSAVIDDYGTVLTEEEKQKLKIMHEMMNRLLERTSRDRMFAPPPQATPADSTSWNRKKKKQKEGTVESERDINKYELP